MHVDEIYINITREIAKLSRAKRNNVGALIVSNGVIVSTGFNGTPRGTDNCCEIMGDSGLETKPDVIHAEINAILNLIAAKSSPALNGSTLYVTFSPCIRCAAVIKQVGISRVVYEHEYRLDDGKKYLADNGVIVESLHQIFEDKT